MKGILFKPDMIQAIVEGRKTQTRRLIKPQPKHIIDKHSITIDGQTSLYIQTDLGKSLKVGYQVGETVYIKEAFIIEQAEDFTEPSDRPFKNDYEWGLLIPHYKSTDPDPDLYDEEDRLVSWRSPLFMPEWAARYFIKILAVRAERLQEITEDGCVAEGYPLGQVTFGLTPKQLEIAIAMRIGWYHTLWNSINKDYQWESNPWVFVYEFNFSKGYFEK